MGIFIIIFEVTTKATKMTYIENNVFKKSILSYLNLSYFINC